MSDTPSLPSTVPPASPHHGLPAALGEPEELAAVRTRALQVLEVPSVPVCGLLRLLARTAAASHAVELGGAGGVTAAWILDGMVDRAVFTSIESDPHRHQLAVSGWADVGVAEQVRGILGDHATVLGRLRDDQYDLAVVQTAVTNDTLDELHRLLKDGGLLVALAPTDGPDLESLVATHEGYEDVALPLDVGVVLATAVPFEVAPDDA